MKNKNLFEHPKINLFEELEILENRTSEIKNAVEKGLISERFGEYCASFARINFLKKEASFYARSNDVNNAIESLKDAKSTLDRICTIYMPKYPEQELISLARGKYNGAVKTVKEILSENFGGNLLQ